MAIIWSSDVAIFIGHFSHFPNKPTELIFLSVTNIKRLIADGGLLFVTIELWEEIPNIKLETTFYDIATRIPRTDF